MDRGEVTVSGTLSSKRAASRLSRFHCNYIIITIYNQTGLPVGTRRPHVSHKLRRGIRIVREAGKTQCSNQESRPINRVMCKHIHNTSRSCASITTNMSTHTYKHKADCPRAPMTAGKSQNTITRNESTKKQPLGNASSTRPAAGHSQRQHTHSPHSFASKVFGPPASKQRSNAQKHPKHQQLSTTSS